MTRAAFRKWFWVHKWTSLVCTLFLLVICVTGLPLIFREEVGDWLNEQQVYADLPADAPHANFDQLVARARQRFPAEIIRSVFIDDDEPKVVVALAPDHMALPNLTHWMRFDARTGELLKEIPSTSERPLTFLTLMLRLHADLFAGLPGALFMGFMGLLFTTAIVSGIVLYGPFMRKLDFGAVRHNRTTRIRWLDLHNLLGVVTLAWALVLGLTGVLNELSKPLFDLWRATEVAPLIASYKDKPMPERPGSVQAAYDKAASVMPGRFIASITFPTTAPFGSPHHYIIWTKGNEPLTSRLFSPLLIDAETGDVTAKVQMPWYLTVLQVSRPLHFGDYGGMPLKIIWALFDLVTIVVLGSGLYLWVSRRAWRVEAADAELVASHAASQVLPREAAE